MTLVSAARLPQQWSRTIVALLLFAGAFLAGFYPTLLTLHSRWSALDEPYSHGYLVLATALFLFYDQPPTVAGIDTPALYRITNLLMLALASMLWLFFYLAGITVVQLMILPFLTWCIGGAVWGKAIQRRMLVPCLMMYLAIPLWDELLTTPLQRISTTTSSFVVKHLFGIAVSTDGFFIHIPAGTFEIEGGCSGLVFLLTAVTLGTVYGQFFLRSTFQRLATIAIAAALGIVSNWIRIISLILIGQYSEMKNPLIGEGHLMFGFYVFGAIFVVVLVITNLVLRRPAAGRQPVAAKQDTSRQDLPWPAADNRFLIAALLALSLGPLTAEALRHSDATAGTQAQPTINTDGVLTPKSPPYKSGFIDASIDAFYRYATDPLIEVHVVYYRNPFGGGKLVSQNNLTVPRNWRVESTQPVTIEGLPTLLSSRLFDENGKPYLMLSGYGVDGQMRATESAARLALLRQAVRLQTAGSFVSITTSCLFEDCRLSDRALEQHARKIFGALDSLTLGRLQ